MVVLLSQQKNNAENQRCDLSQRYRAIKPDTKFHSHNSHTKSHDISFSAYHTKVAHTSFSRPISIGRSVSNAPDILIGKHQRMAKRTSDSTKKNTPSSIVYGYTYGTTKRQQPTAIKGCAIRFDVCFFFCNVRYSLCCCFEGLMYGLDMRVVPF